MRTLPLATSMLLISGFATAQKWTKGPTYPGSGAGSAWLMTDGTVIVHTEQQGGHLVQAYPQPWR